MIVLGLVPPRNVGKSILSILSDSRAVALVPPVVAFRYAADSGTLPRVPTGASQPDRDLPHVWVTLAGRSITVPRAAVKYAEATGDYARLVTRTGSHLVRIPIAELADKWADHGFVRVHRRWLVQVAEITDLRSADGRLQLLVGNQWLDVSRRRAAEVRALLVARHRVGLVAGTGGRQDSVANQDSREADHEQRGAREPAARGTGLRT